MPPDLLAIGRRIIDAIRNHEASQHGQASILPMQLSQDVPADTEVLIADSTQPNGMKWGAAGGGGGMEQHANEYHTPDMALASELHDAVTIGADGEHSLAGQVLSGVAATAVQAGHATAAQITKLDGIEAAADVTDATNVNAAGAVMETDFDATTFLYATADNTPQAKTPAQVMAILSGQAAAAFAMNSQKITGLAAATGNGDAMRFNETPKLAGQLGGTVASPDIRGLRETTGPTLLTLGAVADGEYLKRVGATVVGGTPAGGGGAHAILSATHSDTMAGAVVKGELIVGAGSPAVWAGLTIGTAHSVLWSDGTDPSWQTAPELQYIADTGGTTRITTAAASPHVVITGNTQFSGTIGLLGATPSSLKGINMEFDLGTGAVFTGIAILPTGISDVFATAKGIYLNLASISTSLKAALAQLYGVDIAATAMANPASTSGLVRGLNFAANFGGGDAGAVFAEVTATRLSAAIVDYIGTLTNYRHFWCARGAVMTTTSCVITNGFGIDIENLFTDEFTNVYGINIDPLANGVNRYGLMIGDIAGGTIARILELGPTPYLRLLGSGNWTPAANGTPLYLAEGVTPTLRQVKWKAPDATGHLASTDKVLVLV